MSAIPPTKSDDVAETELPNIPTRLVMLIGGLMVSLALIVIAPVLPQIEHALAHTTGEKLLVKMLVPFAGTAMIVGAPLTGFLVDRLQVRTVLVGNSLLLAIAGTAGFYLDNLYVLLATRLFVGVAAAGMATLSMTLINTRLHGLARARWMGFHISVAMLGSLIVFPAIGALGELGWRWPFLIYSVGLPIALMAVLFLHDGPARLTQGTPETVADRNPFRWFPLRLLPLALVVGSVTYLPTVYLPFVARASGLSSPSAISGVMLADSLIGAGMALIFGWSQRRLSSSAAFIVSFSCTGVGMLIVSLAGNFLGVIAGMLVFGFGIGWFVPNLMNGLSRRVTQQQQGRAVGILKAVHYSASPLAVLAVEPITRAFGPQGAMMASAILSLGLAAIFVFLTVRTNLGNVGPVGLSCL
jgi:MFS family permease